ncbi:tetraspanin-18-like [Ostrea edulis]|uniref:tetraspanin-18-like n=1 Tax=Ostrea edulis TaxID=37623 RepID=UPI00209633B4|nr:tetraspanin-18-like [Ostrea edulis]XP_048776355.1 tetraspanin-18-like [Ostrea edulis]XP_048776356.1 tetraspanin-18-like [Ostrea edulis]XP_056011823.1 tetraspanin-18-like [Ostrea edulis]
MGACAGVSSFFLVIVNTIFSLVGITLVVVGSIVRWGDEFMNNILQDSYSKLTSALQEAGVNNVNLNDFNIADFVGDATLAFIILGDFFFILGIIGCVGACCKFKRILVVYVIFLVILLLAEVTFIILIFAVRSEVDNWFKKPFQKAIKDDYKGINASDSISLAINFVSVEFKCCGVDSYRDFNSSNLWRNETGKIANNPQIPVVCCKIRNSVDTCVLNPNQNNSYSEQGCYGAIDNWLKDNQIILIGVGGGVLAVEIMLMIFALVVCKSNGKTEEDDD